ncbi:shikimate dehydrogenase [Neoasaia chiangmaiensis]|uniref:Shikimate dehydrogenase (NADP(+)) n=1 Tax=Neoasaia chiangmaiensis TaxID=320497 RepID=A0A1U9KSY0_9PROT|nr:shikimate dehydrogenase [Neoasaia chiangmaiensis]AQS88839.1 shikimate dehydrogenase [Neoasaia chiangmaiensis]
MAERNFRSQLTGSFSSPSKGNPTVAMVEAGYRHARLDARFINCDVKPANLEAAVRGAVAMEWVGFNCSLPHKVEVIKYLDDVAESASIIGAVNCVAIQQGKLIGHNTDGKGFLSSLRSVTDPKGRKIVLLGAGGAARAIAVELGLAGAAHLTIVNRSREKAEAIAKLVTEHTQATASAEGWSGDYAVSRDAEVLINATSIGLGDPDALPNIDLDSLREGLIVADVIPNPPVTRLLREAKQRGCTTLDGLGMLVNQALVGTELWFGQKLDGAVMHKTLADIFAQD